MKPDKSWSKQILSYKKQIFYENSKQFQVILILLFNNLNNPQTDVGKTHIHLSDNIFYEIF